MSETTDSENRKKQYIRETVKPPKKKRWKGFVKGCCYAVIAGLVCGTTLFGLSKIPIRTQGKTETETEDSVSQTTSPYERQLASLDARIKELEWEASRAQTTRESAETEPNETETEPVETEPQEETTAPIRPASDAAPEIHQIAREAENNWLVTITITMTQTDWMHNTTETRSRTWGIITSRSGGIMYVLTNTSELEGAESITLSYGEQSWTSIRLVAADSTTGVSLLRVNEGGTPFPESWNAAPVADSAQEKVGDSIIYLGSPLGIVGSVDTGLISVKETYYNSTDITLPILYTNMNSYGGNGILVNTRGEVVGWVRDTGVGSLESGSVVRAVDASVYVDIVNCLMTGKAPARLGVIGQAVPSDQQEENGTPAGVYVSQVTAGSAAESAGLQGGDIITALGETSVSDMNDLHKILLETESGTQMTMTVQRWVRDTYTELTLTVVLQ